MNLTQSQSTTPIARGLAAAAAALAVLAGLLAGMPARAQTGAAGQESISQPGGPVRLRQPVPAEMSVRRAETLSPAAPAPLPPAKPGEFEDYVRSIAGGGELRRFGVDLVAGLAGTPDVSDYNPLIPPTYVLRAGDTLVLTMWGAVDAEMRLQVDRSGRIVIPRVGPVMVSGVQYADLQNVIKGRVGQVFKNFDLSVSLAELRGIRLYVTGFVERPGTVVVNGLSTAIQSLLRAGGPSAAGSFRNIQLRRGAAVVATIDLYDLLLKGDRSGDPQVQSDDVLYVGPVGDQVAIIGSVNRPAIFEVRKNETVDDLLRMAGGYNAVADTSRLTVERLVDRSGVRITQVEQPAAGKLALTKGDVVRAFNAVDATQPVLRQNTRVRVEGEVVNPGEYVLPPASSMADAIRAAGGLTKSAFLYGTEFSRDSVRATQQRNYERALRDFELQLTRNDATSGSARADDAGGAGNRSARQNLLEQLRSVRPTGRVVLQMTPQSAALPDLALETGDRIYVPPVPSTVGVFGSVFSAGSYLYSSERSVGDYLRLAGGSTRNADDASVFIVRANGSVVSSLQRSRFFASGNQLAGLPTEPGDTIFVPDDLSRTTFVQNMKDWSQVFYQLGLGVAGIKALGL
jgi:protein involved in polysaccharide export with SLBB domain